MSVAASGLSEAEAAAARPYFTNLDRPVFALVNLPETVKGALFARYSRSAKSLRRLFLDEFQPAMSDAPTTSQAGIERAERLYQRVFSEFGDDSVAQLGGAEAHRLSRARAGFDSVPRPSMVMSTVCPSTKPPRPDGVPVMMMSPGSSVHTSEM